MSVLTDSLRKADYDYRNRPIVLVDIVGDKTWTLEQSALSPHELNEIINHNKLCHDISSDGAVVTLTLPAEHVTWGHSTVIPNVMTCAYNATSQYLQKFFGCSLDIDDMNWYKTVPNMEAGGLPADMTFRVLQALVAPYGFGISRIFWPKNTPLTDEAQEWAQALGVNPYALTDTSTTNAQAIELLGCDLGWGFEFVDAIPSPSVYMAGSVPSAAYASGGGHASMAGPRSSAHRAAMGLRYDRLENIRYLTPPPMIQHEGPHTTRYPNIKECKAQDGSPLFPKTQVYSGGQFRSSGSVWRGGDYRSAWADDPYEDMWEAYERRAGLRQPALPAMTGESAGPATPSAPPLEPGQELLPPTNEFHNFAQTILGRDVDREELDEIRVYHPAVCQQVAKNSIGIVKRHRLGARLAKYMDRYDGRITALTYPLRDALYDIAQDIVDNAIPDKVPSTYGTIADVYISGRRALHEANTSKINARGLMQIVVWALQ